MIWIAAVAAPRAAQERTAPAPPAVPLAATGEEIYHAACATCHGTGGAGAAQAIVGFGLPLPNGHGFPDFTDCSINTVEPMADWAAVTARGGPVRALDRHMPAFGDALSSEQIERVVRYLWTFCPDAAWPRGELNLPRAFFTEKAFPENETVWTSGIAAAGAGAITSELVYEHRIGARGQYEVKVPVDLLQNDAGGWSRGLGDIELALRRTFYASLERGSIMAAGAAIVLPTGKEERGLGKGTTIVEPFAMYGQMIGTSGFLQLHAGYEIATDRARAGNEGFLRTAAGYTFAQDGGVGRAWSPMTEVLVAVPEGGRAEWDVVPQVQVSLSKLQHVLLSVGVRVPLNAREERKPQLLTYVLWDWFDGGLLDFWR